MYVDRYRNKKQFKKNMSDFFKKLLFLHWSRSVPVMLLQPY